MNCDNSLQYGHVHPYFDHVEIILINFPMYMTLMYRQIAAMYNLMSPMLSRITQVMHELFAGVVELT